MTLTKIILCFPSRYVQGPSKFIHGKIPEGKEY
jgi:hypothetical protein